MNLLALLLGIGGTATVVASGAVLWTSRPIREYDPAMILCEAPSPDGALRCDQEIGHLAWHRCDGSEWYGDSWAVSEWADTQEALPVDPEPTMSAGEWAKLTVTVDLIETEGRPATEEKIFTGPNENWAVWELKVEAKRRGLTGYSNLNKQGLLRLLEAEPTPKPSLTTKPKIAPNRAAAAIETAIKSYAHGSLDDRDRRAIATIASAVSPHRPW